MAPDPVTQARIYEAIKEDLLAGLLRPGVRVDISAIADRHRTSVTPVREVLHRLVGERLLAERQEGGLRLAVPDTLGLGDLYAWNAQLILSAIRSMPSISLKEILKSARARDPGHSPADIARWVSWLFLSLGGATSNVEFLYAIENTSERLNFARFAEVGVFSDARAELIELVRNGALDLRGAFSRRIRAYHRRRIKASDAILKAADQISQNSAH